MPILRKREIENLEQMSGEELKAFLDRLPEGPETVSELQPFSTGCPKVRRRSANCSITWRMNSTTRSAITACSIR